MPSLNDNEVNASSDDFNSSSSFFIPFLDPSLVAIPAWEALIVLTFLPLIIFGTVVGNVLVIISVFTHAPLKITPNYFIVSLSMADIAVAVFVLPFNVIYILTDRWLFVPVLCKMWLTADVLCCTASILNLCAIALDRYQALHDPIAHAQRRTVRYVLTKIFFVWLFSCLICLPPLIGWNDWPEQWTQDTPCKLTEERGYVVYSSMGSFFIPLALIVFVYYRIFKNTRQRLRKRAKDSNLTMLKRAGREPRIPELLQEEQQQHLSAATAGADLRPATLRVVLREAGGEGNGVRCQLVVDEEEEEKGIDRGGGGTAAGLLAKEKMGFGMAQGTNGNSSQHHNGDPQHLKSIVTPPQLCRQEVIALEEMASGGIGKSYVKTLTGTATTSAGTPEAAAKASTTTEQSKTAATDQVYQFINEKAKISLAKERKAARTMTIIVSTFVVCWLPFFLMYVILPFCPTCETSREVVQFITWLGYTNSLLNPLIYTIFNVDFRIAFSRIMTGKICKFA